MDNTTFRVRRLGLWLPAALFFGLSLILVASAPHLGTRVFYAAMALVTGVWLIRCCRASVETLEAGLIVRGQVRTRRFSWNEVAAASLAPTFQ
jgi:hypothetical protein